MSINKILITGGSGMLGNRLVGALEKTYNVLAPTSTECNILDLQKLTHTIEQYNPDLLIHTAAHVDTFGCEENPERALRDNIEGTLNIVKACIHLPCKVVYISSEYVFGGSKGNYDVKDRLDPKNVYGKTKAASEYIVSVLPSYQIIRAPFISKIYDEVFTDQYCSRYFLEDIIEKIIYNILNNTKSLIHIAAPRTSLYNLYKQKGLDPKPVTMSEYYTKVIPHDTSLIDNSL